MGTEESGRGEEERKERAKTHVRTARVRVERRGGRTCVFGAFVRRWHRCGRVIGSRPCLVCLRNWATCPCRGSLTRTDRSRSCAIRLVVGWLVGWLSLRQSRHSAHLPVLRRGNRCGQAAVRAVRPLFQWPLDRLVCVSVCALVGRQPPAVIPRLFVCLSAHPFVHALKVSVASEPIASISGYCLSSQLRPQ